jgi:hypothetical protein
MLGKTMYATAVENDVTDDGHGLIRILAELNESSTEVDRVTYPVDKDFDRQNRDIRASLDAAGYQVVGSTTEAVNGLIIPVARRSVK